MPIHAVLTLELVGWLGGGGEFYVLTLLKWLCSRLMGSLESVLESVVLIQKELSSHSRMHLSR